MITGKSDTALSPTLVVTDDRPELKLQSELLFPTGLAEMRFRMEPIQKRRVRRHSRSIERLAEFLDNLALVFGVFFGALRGLSVRVGFSSGLSLAALTERRSAGQKLP